MTDKPIIFSAPMVQALLAGRKSQTRRVLKPQPVMNEAGLWVFPPEWDAKNFKRFGVAMQCPADAITSHFEDTKRGLPYAPGDRLYVREACAIGWCGENPSHVWYRADGEDKHPEDKWHPSIHMPRWASRLTLTVTEVRVQRLQEISEADAVAEGGIGESGEASCGEGYCDAYWFNHGQLHGESFDTARDSYSDLWNSLHGPDAWSANPWVVAVSFTVEQRNIDA